MARIFHIAAAADWTAAQASGSYTTSTIGRSLVEEGFIHASRADQWQRVRSRCYADATDPLVLLVIDTEQLTSPVVEEVAGNGDETFPHVYGPINPSAVVQTIPLDGRPAPTSDASFSQLFMSEVFHRVVLALIAMTTAVVGALVGAAVERDLGPSVGLLIGLAVGVLLAILVHRRRR